MRVRNRYSGCLGFSSTGSSGKQAGGHQVRLSGSNAPTATHLEVFEGFVAPDNYGSSSRWDIELRARFRPKKTARSASPCAISLLVIKTAVEQRLGRSLKPIVGCLPIGLFSYPIIFS